MSGPSLAALARIHRPTFGESSSPWDAAGRVGWQREVSDLAVRVFHVISGRAAFAAERSGRGEQGWVADPIEQLCPSRLPGPGHGQVHPESPTGGRDASRDVDELAAEGRILEAWMVRQSGGAGRVVWRLGTLRDP